MKSAKKSKPKAISRVPQSREDAIWAVGRIGTLGREIAAKKALADEAARMIGERYEQDVVELAAELEEHERGVQTWCEANRNVLTADGKVKYHDFGTGRVNWRAKPPRVSVRAVETAIEACKRLGFMMFVRTKEELNKEAMLADPDKARLIAGVSISSDGELFEIEPLELEISTVQ